VGKMSSMLTTTNASISTMADRTAAESGFQAQLSSSQAGSVAGLGNSAVSGAKRVVNNADNGLTQTVGLASMDLAALGSDFEKFATDQNNRLQRGLSATSGMAQTITGNVSANRAETDVQLMMAQRTVMNLLSAWSTYADFETEKFHKMNQTDNEYIELTQQRINASSASGRTSLDTSRGILDSLDSNSTEAVADFVDFRNSVAAGLEGYRSGLGLLNKTTSAGIGQIRESAFNYDANDEFLDKTTRDDLLKAVVQFETDLDQKANQTMTSLR
jgi:hypothetical protein